MLHFLDDPGSGVDGAGTPSYAYHADGGLLIEGGLVRFCGAWTGAEAAAPPGTQRIDHRGKLICPGFIDAHIHYPQTDMVASPGHGLLDWLERYAFPAERRFADAQWRRRSPSSSAPSCCATAPPVRWCSAPCIRSRSMR